MTAPKLDTIRRWCDNGLAVEILHERGIITDDEAAHLHARDRAGRDAAYDWIYKKVGGGPDNGGGYAEDRSAWHDLGMYSDREASWCAIEAARAAELDS